MMFQQKIKETFERIGIPEAERAYLAGASAQYESEVVYHNMKEEYDKLGIVLRILTLHLKSTQSYSKNILLNLSLQQIIS